MASTNPNTFFTITQPFLGAPLQFQPALGTKELEELIDTYVIGSACKQDKFSEVTLDFYNNATVDLNTGALTRTYHVHPSPWTSNAFEQSPTQSQSSGFSPIFTPSPSSSATFGDSAYGSVSMTPPNRNRVARVTKKAKKDTPKATEARLPGFSIMTKDGIDVTNSAGRGTKTKEQREHAHLMRIMKACESCKKKKIRCDPSHRRSHNDMSRTSTSTTQTSSSGRLDPSPVASIPSLSRVTTHALQGSLPSFSPSNPIDDFVLFPEDSTCWNADMSFPELETQDLGQFNFDINDIDLTTGYPSMTADHSFEFSFDRQPSSFQPDTSFGYTPNMSDQYGLDQWAEPQGYMPVSHTRPHPSGPTNDSGQLDSNWQSGWLQAESLISPRPSTFADNYWPDGLVDHPQIPQNSASSNTPLLSESPDSSLFESSIIATSSSTGDSTATNGLSQASEPRRSRKRRAVDEQESGRTSGESLEQFGQVSLVGNSPAIELLDRCNQQQGEGVGRQPTSGISSAESLLEQGRSPFSTGSSTVSQEISRLKDACQLVSKSLNLVAGASSECTALGKELQELQYVLERLESIHHFEILLSDSTISMIESLRSQLQVVLARLDKLRLSGQLRHQRYNKLDRGFQLDRLRELQDAIGLFFQSLYITIDAVQLQHISKAYTTSNSPMLTSGRNLQLFMSSSESHDYEGDTQALGSGVQIVDSTSIWQNSRSSSAGSGVEAIEGVLQRANSNIETLDMYPDLDGVGLPTRNERDIVGTARWTVRDVPRYSMLLKTRPSDLLPQDMEMSRLSERSERLERDLVSGMDPNRLVLPLSVFNADETQRRILPLEQAISRLQEEQTGELATAQQDLANFAIPSSHANQVIPTMIRNPQAALRIASTQEVVLSQSNSSTSLQATSSHQSLSSFVLQTLPSSIINGSCSFAAALVILGSLALASSIFLGLDISAHLPYLLPLLVLSLLLPSQRHISTALLASTLLFTTTFNFSSLQALRTTCTDWIGNEPFSATAKLLLCAMLISSELLSSINLPFITVAALKAFSETRDAWSFGSGVRVPRGKFRVEGPRSYTSWLGMMDILSPVASV